MFLDFKAIKVIKSNLIENKKIVVATYMKMLCIQPFSESRCLNIAGIDWFLHSISYKKTNFMQKKRSLFIVYQKTQQVYGLIPGTEFY